MKTGGILFGVFLMVAVSVLLFVSREYHPLAKKLPQLVGFVVLALLAWDLGISFWQKKRRENRDEARTREKPTPFVIKRWLTLGISLTAYVLLLPRLGFLVMTSLLMISQLWFFNVRRPVVVIAYTAVTVGIIYGVFARVLYVPLPAGTWW